MTIDHAADVAAIGAAPSPLSTSARRTIFLYLGMLIVLLAFGGPSGGLIDIPISFLLKNRLHLEAHEVARRLIAASADTQLARDLETLSRKLRGG